MKYLIDKLVGPISVLEEEMRQSFPLVKQEVDLIIDRGVIDEKQIETLLDSLMNYILMGIGDIEYVRLVNYYKGVSPEGAEFYERLCSDMFEDEE